MKSKKLKILTFVAILIITFGAYLLHLIGFIFAYQDSFYKVILFALLGVVITFILAPLFHEIGHLIFGLCSGLKLVSFSIYFIKLIFYKKFSIYLEKNYAFGETVFIPKSPNDYPKKLKITTVGGLLFSAIYMLLGMVIVFLSKDLFLAITFGLSYHISAYILLINLIPFKSDSDGALLLSFANKNGVYEEMLNNVLSLQAEIMCGTEPKDVSARYLTEFQLSYDYYSVLLKYFRYIAFLWRDEESAFKELFDISDLNKVPDSLYETIYKELFFASIVRGDNAFIKANEDVAIGYLENTESPSNFRIHSAYRQYKGDTEWANIIIETGLKTLGEDNGLEKYEKRLLALMKSDN